MIWRLPITRLPVPTLPDILAGWLGPGERGEPVVPVPVPAPVLPAPAPAPPDFIGPLLPGQERRERRGRRGRRGRREGLTKFTPPPVGPIAPIESPAFLEQLLSPVEETAQVAPQEAATGGINDEQLAAMIAAATQGTQATAPPIDTAAIIQATAQATAEAMAQAQQPPMPEPPAPGLSVDNMLQLFAAMQPSPVTQLGEQLGGAAAAAQWLGPGERGEQPHLGLKAGLPDPTGLDWGMGGLPVGDMGMEGGFGPGPVYMQQYGLGGDWLDPWQTWQQGYLPELFDVFGLEQAMARGRGVAPAIWEDYLQPFGASGAVPAYGQAGAALQRLIGMGREGRGVAGIDFRHGNLGQLASLLQLALRPHLGLHGAGWFTAPQLGRERTRMFAGQVGGGIPGSFLDYIRQRFNLQRFGF